MSERVVLQTSVDKSIMVEAQMILERKGLSISEVLETILRQIVIEKDFYIPHIPNAETQEALEASVRNEGIFTANSIDELFEHLDKGAENNE